MNRCCLIIFKSWKSNFHIADVSKANAMRVKAYVYSALIFATLFNALIFSTVTSKAKRHSNTMPVGAFCDHGVNPQPGRKGVVGKRYE